MPKNILSNSFRFIKKHIVDIILVVLVFVLIAIYNVMNNIHSTKTHPIL